MDCSTASLSITKFELAHTHVHLVGDAIQPSHPLSSLSLPAFNLSQHEGSFPVSQFFASGGQSTGFSASASASASVLPMNIEDGFPLGWADWISSQFKWLSSLLQHRSLLSRGISLRSVCLFTKLLRPFRAGGVWGADSYLCIDYYSQGGTFSFPQKKFSKHLLKKWTGRKALLLARAYTFRTFGLHTETWTSWA